jgi:hypothetical protein
MDKNAERAEKIFDKISGDDCPDADECVALIKQAIDEAVREHDSITYWPEREKIARKEGILEGLRMAAGIAIQVWDSNTKEFFGKSISDLIKAKARELSQKEDKE